MYKIDFADGTAYASSSVKLGIGLRQDVMIKQLSGALMGVPQWALWRRMVLVHPDAVDGPWVLEALTARPQSAITLGRCFHARQWDFHGKAKINDLSGS